MPDIQPHIPPRLVRLSRSLDYISKMAYIVFLGALALWITALGYYLLMRPLWLDELLHAMTSLAPFPELASTVAESPGATPVTYLPQILLFRLVGYSDIGGRSVALLAYVCTLWVIWKNVKDDSRIAAIAAVSLFAVLPLSSRYAIELRPYSILLMLSAFAHWLYLRSAEYSRWTCKYIGASIVGVLTLPIFLATPLSHVVAGILLRLRGETASAREQMQTPVLAILFAAVAFLPWYIYVSSQWRTTIRGIGGNEMLEAKVLLLILRELTGAGYVGTICLILLAVAGLSSRLLSSEKKVIWLSALVIPVPFALFVDFVFGYFFAIRQVLCLLVPLCVLAGYGVAALYRRKGRITAVLSGAVVFLHLVYAIRWLHHVDEDWQLAAREAIKVAGPSGCVLPQPTSARDFLPIAYPRIEEYFCDEVEDSRERSPIVILDSKYEETDPQTLERLRNVREASTAMPVVRVGRFRIEGLRRREK